MVGWLKRVGIYLLLFSVGRSQVKYLAVNTTSLFASYSGFNHLGFYIVRTENFTSMDAFSSRIRNRSHDLEFTLYFASTVLAGLGADIYIINE